MDRSGPISDGPAGPTDAGVAIRAPGAQRSVTEPPALQPMPLKVSVIVPVFNAGTYLDRCVDSILGQSLPETEYEVIFVDDGSTDGSPARLDALSSAHANVRVIHQENSGWPGKPRNVGIAAARGEYLFFLDQDDALGPHALERLHGFALLNGSDVVIGRTVGHGRWVPTQVFARTRDRVTLWDSPIVESLTPHKLFRHAFITAHGIRFPEGRRRLEDHVFVLRAYFAASVISILAEPVCYHFYQRLDEGGASTGLTDPAAYYGFVREVLAIVEAHTEPGPGRDALLRRFARIQLLNRLRGPRFLGHPDRYRASLFAEIRSVVDDHIPPTVDELLAPFNRTQMALVRLGRLDLLVVLATWELRLGAAVLGRSEPTGSGPFDLVFDTGLAMGRRPLGIERQAERFLVEVPHWVADVVPDEARTVPLPLSGGASVFARRRGDFAQLAIHRTVDRRIDERSGRCMIVDHVEATIDPGIFATGWASRPTTWDVVARVGVVGVTREVRVARLRITAAHGVVLQRGPARREILAAEVRHLGLAAAIAVSRRLDDRLRQRLWHVAARIVRHLDE